ncbi:branched-chain amino acid ABC transporter permease/ATP-binding protein [Haloechinothrix halophila]|uniref:branched-chain amino acid ABC transporter permease/ATP-binding protein n=1 Tax=Haloechinothrix halophila TaxID=1069073 RepID=UPI00041C076A|nr:branched-chain amino acid ABC transporter permease/ATP-binding protein [Haloechinothrix halophila]
MKTTMLKAWASRRKAIAIIGVAVVTLFVLWPKLSTLSTDSPTGSWEAPPPVLMLGAIVGTTYGLLAAGLVIVYRTNKVINFAHGEIGAFAAAVFGLSVVGWGLPYWLAFPLALALGGLVAAGTEVVVIRRLRNAPKLMSIIATLGVGQFLLLFGFTVNDQAGAGQLYPQPPGLPDFMMGGLRVSPAYSGMLLLSPILVIGLGVFLKRSRYGIGIRSASANSEAARLAGIMASRMSSLAWGLAGILAAFTAILTQPTRGFTTAESFGPSLLLMALAGAVIARMTSIPVAVIAGVGLGLFEQVLKWNYPGGGAVELAIFALILIALLVQKQRGGRQEDKGSWAAVQAIRPLPEELRSLWLVRNMGRLFGIAALGLALLLPLLMTHSAAVSMTVIFAYAIVALSLVIVTGMGGQLTLGQFAFAGIGAVASYHISMRTGWFPLSFLYAGVVAALVALLVGLPALRIRGLMITVTTLAFALATPAAIIAHPALLGDGVDPGRPIVFGIPLDSGKAYYFVGLATLLVALLLARNIRSSGFGRLLIAVRDNEDNARAFTVGTTAVKMQGMLIAGFLAGIGGAMYGHALSFIGETAFPVTASIDVAKIAVIGGISMITGPLVGALFVMGVPTFVPLDTAGLAATSFGQLLIIMYLPKGLVQIIVPLRDRVARVLGGRAGIDVDAAYARRDGHSDGAPAPTMTRPREVAPVMHRNGYCREKLLEAQHLRKHFGGVKAVDDVSFTIYDGETVGLIGPNGAGKTTTFELVSGFTQPDRGTAWFQGRDVTWLTPEARGRLGLVRSFQDAALFPTMTVEETVMLACERTMPTRFASSVLGMRYGDVRKRRRARDIVEFMGLERYRTKQILELSTGTRRITELACLVALEPKLLLLDEPSSGVAQRETEALGILLRDLKRQFDMTLVIIEHDIPMVMSLSDRVIAMADGRILAAGTPERVRHDRRVVEAYLGGDPTAIQRSGQRDPVSVQRSV